MDTQDQMAFEFAADLAKQLITLSTGILVLTITFTKELLKRISSRKLWFLKLAWIGYFLTIVFGIFSLMALTGKLAPKEVCHGSEQVSEKTATAAEKTEKQEPNDIKCVRIPRSARNYASVQIIFFLTATILITVYGVTALKATNGELVIKDGNGSKKKD